MATNMIYGPERTRSLPVTADTPSGSPVVVGGFVGVALTAEGEGGNVDGEATVGMGGATRQAVGTTTALAIGDPVYITSAYALTPSSASGANALFGYALTAKGTTAGEVIDIELHQV
jgi:predicted RecA/RadA family phage recombinase